MAPRPTPSSGPAAASPTATEPGQFANAPLIRAGRFRARGMALPDRKGATAISLSCLKYFARTRTQYARTARKRMRAESGSRLPSCTRPACRGRRARTSYHGIEKRTAAHACRRFRRKSGEFWRAQFWGYSRIARVPNIAGVGQCPLSGANQKSYAQSEFFWV